MFAYEHHHYPRDPDHLIQIMGDDDIRRSATAARLLAAQGKDPLLRALRNLDPGIRSLAAQELGHFQDAQVVDALELAATDPNAHVRMSVADALGEIGDLKTVPVLRALQTDNVQIVRTSAVRAIARIEQRE
jgi:HEAT repeat protein